MGIEMENMVWRSMNVSMWWCSVLDIGVSGLTVSLDIVCYIWICGHYVALCGFVATFACPHAVYERLIVGRMAIAGSTWKMLAFCIYFSL